MGDRDVWYSGRGLLDAVGETADGGAVVVVARALCVCRSGEVHLRRRARQKLGFVIHWGNRPGLGGCMRNVFCEILPSKFGWFSDAVGS